MTFITVGIEVSCLLRHTTATNYGAHTSQFSDVGLILCCSRIWKFVTQPAKENTQRTHREFNYRGHSNPWWIIGLSGPIHSGVMFGCDQCEYRFTLIGHIQTARWECGRGWGVNIVSCSCWNTQHFFKIKIGKPTQHQPRGRFKKNQMDFLFQPSLRGPVPT